MNHRNDKKKNFCSLEIKNHLLFIECTKQAFCCIVCCHSYVMINVPSHIRLVRLYLRGESLSGFCSLRMFGMWFYDFFLVHDFHSLGILPNVLYVLSSSTCKWGIHLLFLYANETLYDIKWKVKYSWCLITPSLEAHHAFTITISNNNAQNNCSTLSHHPLSYIKIRILTSSLNNLSYSITY